MKALIIGPKTHQALMAASQEPCAQEEPHDYAGTDPALIKKLIDKDTHVVRVTDEPNPPALDSYLETLRNAPPARPRLLSSFTGRLSKIVAIDNSDTYIPIDLGNGQTLKARINKNMLLTGRAALFEDTRRIARMLEEQIGAGRDLNFSQLVYNHIPERDITVRGAFNNFTAHYDLFANLNKRPKEQTGRPVTFTILKTYEGQSTLTAKADRLRELFIRAMEFDESKPKEKALADGIRKCDLPTLMRVGIRLINVSPKSFTMTQDWDSGAAGELCLFRESTESTGEKQTFVSGLHSSPEADEGCRTLMVMRGCYYE